MTAVILDSEAISQLAHARSGAATPVVHAAVRAARVTGAQVVVPAAVLAEVYRGVRREQSVDSWLGREAGTRIVPTDQALARQVGRLLDRARLGSEAHVDATCVAAAMRAGGGLILTGDVDDLRQIEGDTPGITIRRC